MLREELWVRRVRLEGSSAAPVPASITLAAGMAVMTGYEMTCARAREKMCAVNVSVEAVIASGPETLRSSQVGDAAAAAHVFPDIRFSRNRRTWASVINPSSTRKTGSLTRLSVGPRTGRSRPRQPARIIVVDHQWEGQPQQASDPPVNSLTLVLYLVGSSVPWLGQNDAGTRYSTLNCSQIVHGCVVSLLAPQGVVPLGAWWKVDCWRRRESIRPEVHIF